MYGLAIRVKHSDTITLENMLLRNVQDRRLSRVLQRRRQSHVWAQTDTAS